MSPPLSPVELQSHNYRREHGSNPAGSLFLLSAKGLVRKRNPKGGWLTAGERGRIRTGFLRLCRPLHIRMCFPSILSNAWDFVPMASHPPPQGWNNWQKLILLGEFKKEVTPASVGMDGSRPWDRGETGRNRTCVSLPYWTSERHTPLSRIPALSGGLHFSKRGRCPFLVFLWFCNKNLYVQWLLVAFRVRGATGNHWCTIEPCSDLRRFAQPAPVPSALL